MWAGDLQNPSAFLGYMSNVSQGGELSIAVSTGAHEQLIDGPKFKPLAARGVAKGAPHQK